MASASPGVAAQPRVETVAVSGESGVATSDHAPPATPSRSRSAGRWRRRRPSSSSAPHVRARVAARSASSASTSAARSRSRRGSTRMTWELSGRRSVSSRSPSTSQGSQLSMPSNVRPPDNRSHCSRPHGCFRISSSARRRTSSVIRSSRAGKTRASSTLSVERWSWTENSLRRSTSSPHRSMRTGASDVDGKTSMIDPRRATSPRCSTSSSRRYPDVTSRARRSSASRTSPGRTTTGSTSSSPGPSRWRSALMAPTTMRGGRPARSLWSSPASRHSTRSRRPIVSTLGLTRSKGSVSQAGKSSTSSGGRYRCRSSTSRCAAVPVGIATRSGDAAGQPGEPGQRQRAGGFRDGQDRAAAAEHGRQGRLVAQELGERLETHRRAEHRTAPGPPFLAAYSGRVLRARPLVTRTTPAMTSAALRASSSGASEPVRAAHGCCSAELPEEVGVELDGSVVTAAELGVVESLVLVVGPVVGLWSAGRSSPPSSACSSNRRPS